MSSQVSSDEFARWLAHGLGRPIIYLRDHDAEPYRDVILDACLHNRCYDQQVEGTRAVYMLEVVNATGTPEFYRDRVIQSLSEPTERDRDTGQRFHFARLLAEKGDVDARRAMYENFRPDPFNVEVGHQFVQLDETAGFLFVAEKLGQRSATHTDWEEGYFQRWVEEVCGETETNEALDRAAESNPAIANFRAAVRLARQQESGRVSLPDRTAMGIPYDEVRELILKSEGRPPLHLRAWGLQASDADLIRAAGDLIAEPDPKRIAIYLWIFYERPFPLSHDHLIRLISSHLNERLIPVRAFTALAKLSHPDIRQFAFELMETRHEKRAFAIEILTNSAEPGDGAIVESWCMAEEDDDALHRLAPNSLEFFDKHPDDAGKLRLLMFYYDRVACAFCRSRWVDKLIALNAVTAEMREELRYDSWDETRALV